MHTRTLTLAIASTVAAGMFAMVPTVQAAANAQPTSRAAQQASKNTFKCKMNFVLSGWSAIYKTSSGHGTVTCSNGERVDVKLSAKGAGLSVGAYKINDGHGTFTGITNIKQIFGTYVKGTAHVGASKSTRAAVMTKNNVSLALTGTGNGWDIGVAITGFTVQRASAATNGQ